MVFAVIIGIIAYFEIGGYFLLGSSREAIGKEIKEAPALPDNFLNVYNAVYPKAFDNGLWSHFFYGNGSPCPCRHASYPYFAYERVGGVFDTALITFQIEDMATQQECLEFVLEHMDYLNGVFGIENASKYYFNKDLKEINEDEALQLIVITKNPSLYNKQKRAELVKRKVEELKQKLNNNIGRRSILSPG